jgi:hypothetical protein
MSVEGNWPLSSLLVELNIVGFICFVTLRTVRFGCLSKKNHKTQHHLVGPESYFGGLRVIYIPGLTALVISLDFYCGVYSR